MQQLKGLGKIEQETFDGYFDRLKGCEAHALARELSLMLVFSLLPPGVKEKVIEQCQTNSKIIRRNRKVATRDKNYKRLMELHGKKKLNTAEKGEYEKLIKYFEPELKKVMAKEGVKP
jgi:hypothetical protein